VTYGAPPGPTAAEVRAAVRVYIGDNAEIELWRAYDGIARRTGVNLNAGTSWGQAVASKFRGQVRRALDQLAGDDELVKVGRNGIGPDGFEFGQAYAGEPRYFTPAGYDQAKRDAEATRAQREFERKRNERLWDDLTTLGFPPLGDPLFERGKPPQLSPDRMAGLISLARQGVDRRG
jgi:hypothetical protein